MNRKKHIALIIAFIVTGITILFSVTDVSAAHVEDFLPKAMNGYAGDTRQEDITWAYDTATKTLTFNGVGDMETNEGAMHITNDKKLKRRMIKKLGTWCVWYKETEHIVIGEGITNIGNYAFFNFQKLEDISIPESVLYIGFGAFEASGLGNITIPKTVKSIYADAFKLSMLEEITIENGVKEIDVGVFSDNYYLKEIIIPESVNIITHDDTKYSAGDGMLRNCKDLKRVTLPSTIVSIPRYFCCGCLDLEEITIPQSVKTIEEYAFAGCSSLKQITIPQSVKTIEEYAFKDCNSLRQITIPESVKTIGEGAFIYCMSLEKVILPQTLKKIDDWTFEGTELQSIKLPQSLKEIGESAFEDTPLKSIKLPQSLEKIAEAAFAETPLKTIVIPKNVKILAGNIYVADAGIFRGCKKLKTVKIKSKKLKKVAGAFEGFPSKAVIIVPKGKKKSYSKMFYKEDLSKKVKIKESKTW